jgi:hypothetical protein
MLQMRQKVLAKAAPDLDPCQAEFLKQMPRPREVRFKQPLTDLAAKLTGNAAEDRKAILAFCRVHGISYATVLGRLKPYDGEKYTPFRVREVKQ